MLTLTPYADADCEICPAQAERRRCVHCGITMMLTDCGHYDQPRPIAADERGRMVCEECYGRNG